MFLTIRTDKPEAELGLFEGAEQRDYITWTAHRELSNTLLKKIDELLGLHDTDPQQISGVVVFKGPGSFTGLRIGLSVGNSFAYALSIPVVSEGGAEWARTGIERLMNGENEKIALPEYGGEANITKPRK